MRFRGSVAREGKWWLAEVPLFDALTQGRTRKEAMAMMADWFATMAGREEFVVSVHLVGKGEFEIACDDTPVVIGLLLRRQRQRSGLSLAEAAQRLGAKSRNAYARYESGTSVPTVAKLDELLRAIAPDRDLVILQGAA